MSQMVAYMTGIYVTSHRPDKSSKAWLPRLPCRALSWQNDRASTAHLPGHGACGTGIHLSPVTSLYPNNFLKASSQTQPHCTRLQPLTLGHREKHRACAQQNVAFGQVNLSPGGSQKAPDPAFQHHRMTPAPRR